MTAVMLCWGRIVVPLCIVLMLLMAGIKDDGYLQYIVTSMLEATEIRLMHGSFWRGIKVFAGNLAVAIG